jgi:arylsulfatase A-like enzyme
MNFFPLRSIAIILLVAGAARGEEPTNVILCMADDLGWGSVGYNGNEVIATPHLDAMASEGVRFDRFYSAAPVCSPTRASCLTGRHPYRTGVFGANSGILRPEEVTLAEVLKEHGYATGHFGKWHLGTLSTTEGDSNRGGSKHPELFNPPWRNGFERCFSTEAKVPTCDPLKRPAKFSREGASLKFGWPRLGADEPHLPYGTAYWNERGERITEDLDGDDSRLIIDRALSFIETAVTEERPFLAVIWFHAPHLPCVATEEYAAMYEGLGFEMQQYAGCITALDAQLGRLRSSLAELGVADRTMLWFCSDNGPERNTPGETGGFRERKRSLHEGGVRVPGLLVWPGREFRGVVTEPVVTSDYFPTILEALEIEIGDSSRKLDGVSILPLLEGDPFERPTPIGFVSSKQVAWNGARYKYYRKPGMEALFDLLSDPYEERDLAGTHPDLMEAQRDRHAAWMAEVRTSFEGEEYGTASRERVKQRWPGGE